MKNIYLELPNCFRRAVPWYVLEECLQEGRYGDILRVLRCEEFSETNDDLINMRYAASIITAKSFRSLMQLSQERGRSRLR